MKKLLVLVAGVFSLAIMAEQDLKINGICSGGIDNIRLNMNLSGSNFDTMSISNFKVELMPRNDTERLFQGLIEENLEEGFRAEVEGGLNFRSNFIKEKYDNTYCNRAWNYNNGRYSEGDTYWCYNHGGAQTEVEGHSNILTADFTLKFNLAEGDLSIACEITVSQPLSSSVGASANNGF